MRRAPRGLPAWNSTDRHCRAGCASLSSQVRRGPRRPADDIGRSRGRVAAIAGEQRLASLRRDRLIVGASRAISGRRSTPARRRAASRARRSSAAGFRPDTTCPGRNAGSRRRETLAQAADQRVGQRALGRADGGGVPLGSLEIVDRHEGRLAAHGQAHVLAARTSSTFAQRVERAARIRRRTGLVMRGCSEPASPHVEGEVDIGEARNSRRYRRGVAEVRRGGQRNMALAGQQARGRVEADPAGAGNVDLAPGMQVGEVDDRCRPGRRAIRGRVSAGSGSRRRSARRGRDGAALHQQPALNRGRSRSAAASVSSGVCTPGSMRMM
jgi:hypothetical protein